MSQPLPPRPLPYDPAYEVLEDDEGETEQQLIDALLKISETVHRDEGHAYRSVHAKSHGLLQGELEVLPGLPEVFAQGVFLRPQRYPVVMRFSSTPGDLLEDTVSTPRGLAIKLIGVEGERLPGSEEAVTQDFVMVNGPVFSTSTAKQFAKSLKLLASTTDKVPRLKNALATTLRGIETLLEKAGTESATLKALGGHPATHPLGETYFTQVPMRYGPYMAKLSLGPVSPELTALTGVHVELKDHPNALRDALVDHFARAGGTWVLRVQLCTDLDKMPIENASVAWSEEDSPYVTVARLYVQPQVAWSEARSRVVDDGMAFSPWHGIAAHRPFGSIMRVRKAAYAAAASYRSERNSKLVNEPRAAVNLPD